MFLLLFGGFRFPPMYKRAFLHMRSSPHCFVCYVPSVFVLGTPGRAALAAWEIIRCPAAYRIHGPFYPSVVLTEPYKSMPIRKSHYPVMLHCCMPEAVRHLQAGYRSCPERPSWRSPLLWLFITGLYLMNVYSVVKVLICFSAVTTRLLRVIV